MLGQSLTADVSVARSTAATAARHHHRPRPGRPPLSAPDGYGVTLANGSGVLVVTAAGVAGRISGQVALVLPGRRLRLGLAEPGGQHHRGPVNRDHHRRRHPLALGLPGRPLPALRGHRPPLTVAGQLLTGDFAFEKVADLADDLARSASPPATSRSRSPACCGCATGTALILLTAHRPGRLDLRHRVARRPRRHRRRHLAIELNTTGGEVDETFIVAGVPRPLLELDAGAFVRVAGTGLQLTVLGQTLTGDLTITRSTDAAGRAGRHASTAAEPRAGPRQRGHHRDDHPAGTDAGCRRRARPGWWPTIGVDVAVCVPGVARRRGRSALVHRQRRGLPQGHRHRHRPRRARPDADPGRSPSSRSAPARTAVVRIGVADGSLDLGGLVERQRRPRPASCSPAGEWPASWPRA